MRANYKVEFASGIFLLLGIAAMIWLGVVLSHPVVSTTPSIG